MKTLKSALSICSAALLLQAPANAGVDVVGTIARMQVGEDGRLWFMLSNSSADPYCLPGWNGMNLYVPINHPEYPYYYATIALSLSKGKQVMPGNISMFIGTTNCDITQTGFGVTIYQ